MIVATVNGKHYKVDALANRADWFGETWLVQCNIGVFAYQIVVEGEHEQAIIDALTDSTAGNLIRDPDGSCEYCEQDNYNECYCTFAGNASERIDLAYCHIHGRCKVSYFERPSNWDSHMSTWGSAIEKVD